MSGFLVGLNSFGGINSLRNFADSGQAITRLNKTTAVIENKHETKPQRMRRVGEKRAERPYMEGFRQTTSSHTSPNEPGDEPTMVNISSIGEKERALERNVYGKEYKAMRRRRNQHLAERVGGNARMGRNAKSLCDSGISTPQGDARFSSLLTVTRCKGSSGHVVGPDFIRGDIPILNSEGAAAGHKTSSSTSSLAQNEKMHSETQGKDHREGGGGEDEERRSKRTEYVGAVTFNQAYTNSPSSLVVCTACNRTDYVDRATNLGMATAYTHPPFSQTRIPGQRVAVESSRSFLWNSSNKSSKDNTDFLTSMSPLTSRAYVSKARVRLPKEMDTVELGDPMCITGSSYGLTYLGSSKINGLTSEIYDPNGALKRRTVRYSVAKLLRRTLPDVLKTHKLSSATKISDDATFWKPFYTIIFCSFERTRRILAAPREHITNLDKKSIENLKLDALGLLGVRTTNQMMWIHQTIEFRKTKQMDQGTLVENMCSCRVSQILGHCNLCEVGNSRDTLLSMLKMHYNIHSLDDVTNSTMFYHWRTFFDLPSRDTREHSTQDTNPNDWKGPWYKSTQTMDEDEMAFFNLDLRYIPEVHRWSTKQKHLDAKKAKDELEGREYSVIATILLKLYVVNDVMRVLSPTKRKHRMLRMLLQMFIDQMLDLYGWVLSSCSPPPGHIRRCRLVTYTRRVKSNIISDEPWHIGLITDEDILKSPCEHDESFERLEKSDHTQSDRNAWKEYVRSNPPSMVRPYDEYYPHGRRFIWSGELPSMGHLFSLTDLWNKHRPSAESMACLINHVVCCKTQPHRCQIRSLSTVIDENKDDSASLIYLIVDIVFVHLMGMYSTVMHRPCWRARGILRAQFLEFATRERKDIVAWIKNNQHVVYNAMRAHMYHQMSAIPSLRAIFLETSWHLENEMASRKAGDFTRAILSDRLSYGPAGLSSLIVTPQEFANARDVAGINQSILDRFNILPEYIEESSVDYERVGFRTRPRYCPHPPMVRQMIYPHMLEGYRKRLHMAGVCDEEADYSRDSMTNQSVFALVDMLNGESLIKCRDFQTKLRKGKFWEQLQAKIIKYISGSCAYVLSLDMWERMQSPTTMPKEREKIEKSMIKEISSYASSVFSVTECDGILSGNHIRAIKAVAMQASKESQDSSGVMNLHWLLPLGVSLGTISYLQFLYYAYEYHDLPDNRLRNDVHYLMDRSYQKPRRKKKSKAIQKTKKRKKTVAKEPQRGDPQTIFCYGSMRIVYESWMDYSMVDYYNEFPSTAKDIVRKENLKDTWMCGVVKDKQMHTVMREYHRLKKERKESEKEQSEKEPRTCGFYMDDEDEYTEEDIGEEVAWRHERVNQVLGRKPTVGEMDIAIICMFFHFYEHSKFFQTVSLTRNIARNQVRALRCRSILMPYQETPPDIGLKRFCGCGRIFDPLVAGPEYITSMYSKGELAAYDLIRKIKRCSKGSTRFCDKPPMVVDMIGRAARIGKTWYVICVICGSLTIWRKESYCELGPTCGCHAAPIRPPSKYPMAFVALSDRSDIVLRQHLLDQGHLMNGWVYCGYCKETIIPGKEVNIRVWDDVVPSGSANERCNPEETEEWWLEHEENSKEVQKVAKTERCRLAVMTLCRDHLKHIGWSIRRHKIYSKKLLMEDLMTISENKMKRRISSRFARAK
ncbi:MAG: hypothetical protein ACTSUE_20070 [Promethearchaeota archaeon]